MEHFAVDVCFIRKKTNRPMFGIHNSTVVPRIGESVCLMAEQGLKPEWFLVSDVEWVVDDSNKRITIQVICA